MDNLIGKRLDGLYEVQELIGSGGRNFRSLSSTNSVGVGDCRNNRLGINKHSD